MLIITAFLFRVCDKDTYFHRQFTTLVLWNQILGHLALNSFVEGKFGEKSSVITLSKDQITNAI